MKRMPGLLFPGQGAQYVGMGADLYERFPGAQGVYDRAVDALELDIRKVSFEGPEQTLRQTQHTQPAILTHSLAVLALLPELAPVFTAGHSLGEYAALYAAGSLDFESVMKLVKRRSELMAEEGERNPGTMAAIIGLDPVAVEQLCEETDGVVVPANYNEPRQTVVSGAVPAVKAVVELATARGALKAVMLPVSGAFHSPLLAESGRAFAEYLEQFEIRTPAYPVIPNSTGRPAATATELRDCLVRQLTSPVQWIETISSARALGCTDCLEIGPGRVLAGLVRRIDREIRVAPVGTADQVAELLSS